MKVGRSSSVGLTNVEIVALWERRENSRNRDVGGKSSRCHFDHVRTVNGVWLKVGGMIKNIEEYRHVAGRRRDPNRSSSRAPQPIPSPKDVVDGPLEVEPEVARLGIVRGTPGLRAGRSWSRLVDPFVRETPWTLTSSWRRSDEATKPNRC